MSSQSLTMRAEAKRRLLERVARDGTVPYEVVPGGLVVVCPECCRQAFLRQDELGVFVEHDARRCRRSVSRCGARFGVSLGLTAYLAAPSASDLEDHPAGRLAAGL